jgi:glutathione S-transferase
MTGEILRLHGYPVSNYFNIARAALIEKALPHEIVTARAAQDEAFLVMNPMGKIPVLESPDGWIGETVAIVEYLDDRYPDVPLRPTSLGERAKARQIVNVVQMYVETPARSLFPGVFGAGDNSAAAIAVSRAALDRSTSALARLMKPQPFLFGEAPSSADLFAFYNLDITDRLTRFVFGRSICEEIGVADWHGRMAARPSSHVVLADFERYFAEYLKDKGAPYRAPDAAPGQSSNA